MKERVLEIRKEILPMKDSYETLNSEEKKYLAERQKQHDDLLAGLSEADTAWYETELANWYAKYLDVETKIFIKPCEG